MSPLSTIASAISSTEAWNEIEGGKYGSDGGGGGGGAACAEHSSGGSDPPLSKKSRAAASVSDESCEYSKSTSSARQSSRIASSTSMESIAAPDEAGGARSSRVHHQARHCARATYTASHLPRGIKKPDLEPVILLQRIYHIQLQSHFTSECSSPPPSAARYLLTARTTSVPRASRALAMPPRPPG